jgi:hypothetical protein
LQFVDCSLIATLFGFEDALLYAVDMLLTTPLPDRFAGIAIAHQRGN